MEPHIALPDAVQNIISELNSHGHEAYAVGGCVRDCILGRTPEDWDITTSALPDEVKAVFPVTIDTGLKHGTVTVRLNKQNYEVTTYRIDGVYEDGRHPKEVTFSRSLSEDLKRRDFTINAMAYNEKDGLIDLFEGQEDLRRGIIRCVGDPDERFSEDALRMLRAVRFSAQLGFSIEEATMEAIRRKVAGISRISAERIRVELTKLLLSDRPETLDTAYRLGLTAVFLPEWDEMAACNQATPHHIGTVAEHTLFVMKNTEPDIILRLSALLHDVAKPLTKRTDAKGRDHFAGHPVLGAEMSKKILRRLTFDNATIDKVDVLVRYHDERPEPAMRAVRRLSARVGEANMPALFKLKRADIAGQSDYERDRKLERIEATEKCFDKIMADKDCLSVKNLAIGGSDVIACGIEAGPLVGKVLDSLLKEVIDDPTMNKREVLLLRVKEVGAKAARFMAVFAAVILLSPLISACGETENAPILSSNRTPSKPYTPPAPEESEQTYDENSLDGLFVVEIVDSAEETMVLRNLVNLRQLRYRYDLTTSFLNTKGSTTSVTRFVPGRVVEIETSEDGNRLKSVSLSDRVWVQDEVDDYVIDAEADTISVGSSVYRITGITEFFSNDIQAFITDIGENDTLLITGLDKNVLTVSVTGGHGYISLINTALFEDSLICIGEKDYELITGDMLLEVPEGTYDVTVANKGYGGTKQVTVGRNETITLDLNELKGAGPKTCSLTFNSTVEDASIYIDGEEVPTGTTLEVEYGRHTLTVTANGYDTWKRTLFVNSESAEITLDPTSSSGSNSAGSDNSATDSSSDGATAAGGTSADDVNKQAQEIINNATSGTTSSSSDTSDTELDYLTTISDMLTTLMGD